LLAFLPASPFAEERHFSLVNILREGSLKWLDEKNRFCNKWKTDFSPEEKKMASATFADAIGSYGYK